MKKEYMKPGVQVKLVALEGTLLIASAKVSDDEVDFYARKEDKPVWGEYVNC